MISRGALVAAVLLCPIGLPLAAKPLPRYSATDLGTLSGTDASYPIGLNNVGDVVGYCGVVDRSDSSNYQVRDRRASLFRNGLVIDVGPAGGGDAEAVAINGRGEIVGTHHLAAPSFDARAFLFRAGAAADIGPLGVETFGRSINDKGQVVGIKRGPDWPYDDESFLYENGKTTLLGRFRAEAINDKGQIAGDKYVKMGEGKGSFFLSHAVQVDGKKITDLGVPDYDFRGSVDDIRPESHATAMNDQGRIAGYFHFWYGQTSLLYSEGRIIDLGPGPRAGHDGLATGINSAGQVVGTSIAYDEERSYPNAVIMEDRRLVALDELVSTPVDLLSANAINDRGQIVCAGAGLHAILLTPLATVKISGKAAYTTHARQVRITGRAAGSIEIRKVKYRTDSDGRYRNAIGRGHWSFIVRLKPGENRITVVARGPGGESPPARVSITRE